MKKIRSFSILAVIFCFGLVLTANAGGPPAGEFWAGGNVYRTVVTPAGLPDFGPKDGLFVFEGLSGQNPVAESEPGDKAYNGGRWQVYVLSFTTDGMAVHDANNDGIVDFQLTDWDMVAHHIDLGHLEMVAMGPSFVCPLIK